MGGGRKLGMEAELARHAGERGVDAKWMKGPNVRAWHVSERGDGRARWAAAGLSWHRG